MTISGLPTHLSASLCQHLKRLSMVSFKSWRALHCQSTDHPSQAKWTRRCFHTTSRKPDARQWGICGRGIYSPSLSFHYPHPRPVEATLRAAGSSSGKKEQSRFHLQALFVKASTARDYRQVLQEWVKIAFPGWLPAAIIGWSLFGQSSLGNLESNSRKCLRRHLSSQFLYPQDDFITSCGRWSHQLHQEDLILEFGYESSASREILPTHNEVLLNRG